MEFQSKSLARELLGAVQSRRKAAHMNVADIIRRLLDDRDYTASARAALQAAKMDKLYVCLEEVYLEMLQRIPDGPDPLVMPPVNELRTPPEVPE
jgi:hypothetical protein